MNKNFLLKSDKFQRSASISNQSVVNGTSDCASKSDQVKQIFSAHVSDVGNRSWEWNRFEIVRDDVSNDLGW